MKHYPPSYFLPPETYFLPPERPDPNQYTFGARDPDDMDYRSPHWTVWHIILVAAPICILFYWGLWKGAIALLGLIYGPA